jgi:glycosyltransferase involved in cell wall biosynthesis/SAM-dependent methyltransferase
MKVLIGAEPGGPEKGYIFPFSLMMDRYLRDHGHVVTFDPSSPSDIALCIAFKPAFEQAQQIRERGGRIVHRLDGRVRSIVKLYDKDDDVRRVNEIADWTIFQSEYVKRHTTLPERTIFGVEAPVCGNTERSSVIYNGVDRRVFHEGGSRVPLRGEIRILHVAISGGVRKGARYLLRIAEHLRNNPDIHFYLIGHQDRDLSCGHLIASGIYPNVTHLGPILDQPELAKYMRSCDVLLFPSVDDYCPNTVLEAMSCGLPVWYHDSGGTPELVRRGQLAAGVPITPENDIQPLQVLLHHLDDFRHDAISIVEKHFTSEMVGRQYLDLFEGLLASQHVVASGVLDSCGPKTLQYAPSPSAGSRPAVRPAGAHRLPVRLARRAMGLLIRSMGWIGETHWPVEILRLLLRSLPRQCDFAARSRKGRRLLRSWFEIHRYAEERINQCCTAYYDGEHPKHYLWLEHNRFLFDGINAGDRVLDIGCGASYYPQWVAEKAAEILAVDILPERVEEARSRNSKTNVRYEVMDVTGGIPQGKFDVAICSHVLEHLEDPLPVLRNLAQSIPRLLAKVPLTDSHWMKLVKRDIGMPWMDDLSHRREYTEALLREHLVSSGWIVQEIVRGYDLRAAATSSLFGKEPVRS